MGHELEFVLVTPDGSALPTRSWTPYGLPPVLDLQGFFTDLVEATARVGIAVEQLHAEYGPYQMELSLPPAPPVKAADAVILTKAIIGQVSRRHGYAASFSPVPFAGGVGNGSHQHFSLYRDGTSLYAGGAGPRGMAEEGAHGVAGVLAGLTQAQGVLTGSILSGGRLAPGFWSGACICWGTENREASVRFVEAGVSNPRGAHVEVKIIDPSANPYLASAVILGLALGGIRRELPLGPEVTEDPSAMSEDERRAAGIDLLHQNQGTMLDELDRSSLMRRILGDQAVEALLAVRRHEQEAFGDLVPEALCDRLRLAWTL